ncbi:hypothetical protein D1872_255510 [compost metagenome]
MYSYSFLSSRIISLTCSGVTAFLSLVCAAGSMYNSSKRLSLTRAWFKRQRPSATSIKSYIILFSRPITTSRLRRPISVSTRHTFLPSNASAVPILAEVVVLPTPPLPDVTTIATPIIHTPLNTLKSGLIRNIFVILSICIFPSHKKANSMLVSRFSHSSGGLLIISAMRSCVGAKYEAAITASSLPSIPA